MKKRKTTAKVTQNISIDMRCYSQEIIDMMDKTEVCLNCGIKLKYLDNKDKRRNRGYCSLKCYYQKPPKMAYIEKLYNKSFREILLELLNKNNNVTLTAQLLGISKRAIYDYIKKLNIKRKVIWE